MMIAYSLHLNARNGSNDWISGSGKYCMTHRLSS